MKTLKARISNGTKWGKQVLTLGDIFGASAHLHQYIQLCILRKAMQIVAEHEQARNALGPPIVVGNVDLADRRRNYVSEFTSEVRVFAFPGISAIRDTFPHTLNKHLKCNILRDLWGILKAERPCTGLLDHLELQRTANMVLGDAVSGISLWSCWSGLKNVFSWS